MKFPIPRDPSEYMLVAANCLPVAGVLLWGWDAFSVMAVFWMENVVIGIVNALKMLCVTFLKPAFQGILLTPFFCFHYGMFTLVHGVFIFMLFTDKHQHARGLLNKADLDDMLSVRGLWPALIALTAHHLFSFFFHFIAKREYKTTDINTLMGAPYGRIVMLHVTLLAGGFLVLSLHNAVWAVLMLTILKTLGELILYQRAHQPSGQAGAGTV